MQGHSLRKVQAAFNPCAESHGFDRVSNQHAEIRASTTADILREHLREADIMARLGGGDLILLDVMMPGLNGFEVVEQLKQQDVRELTAEVLLIKRFK